MNCRAAQHMLSAERDGALADREHAELETHLAGCADCRQMRTTVAVALAHWRSAGERVPSPDAERAWQDIRREMRTTAPQTASERRAFPRWSFAAAAAAALVCGATLGPRWLRPSTATPGAPTQVARADFVETAANASSMVYVDDKSGWLVVWAVTDNDKL